RVPQRHLGLRRKVLQWRARLVGEGPPLLAVDIDIAEQGVVLAQRHPNCAPDAAGLRHTSEARGHPITLIPRHIGKADNPFACQDSSDGGGINLRPDGTTLPDPILKPWLAVHSTKMKALTIPSPENAKGRLAQPRRLV